MIITLLCLCKNYVNGRGMSRKFEPIVRRSCRHNAVMIYKIFTTLAIASVVFLNVEATTINIGGLFSSTTKHGSGNKELAAVVLAISHVNNKTDGVVDNILADLQARMRFCGYHLNFILQSYIHSQLICDTSGPADCEAYQRNACRGSFASCQCCGSRLLHQCMPTS